METIPSPELQQQAPRKRDGATTNGCRWKPSSHTQQVSYDVTFKIFFTSRRVGIQVQVLCVAPHSVIVLCCVVLERISE